MGLHEIYQVGIIPVFSVLTVTDSKHSAKLNESRHAVHEVHKRGQSIDKQKSRRRDGRQALVTLRVI